MDGSSGPTSSSSDVSLAKIRRVSGGGRPEGLGSSGSNALSGLGAQDEPDMVDEHKTQLTTHSRNSHTKITYKTDTLGQTIPFSTP